MSKFEDIDWNIRCSNQMNPKKWSDVNGLIDEFAIMDEPIGVRVKRKKKISVAILQCVTPVQVIHGIAFIPMN